MFSFVFVGDIFLMDVQSLVCSRPTETTRHLPTGSGGAAGDRPAGRGQQPHRVPQETLLPAPQHGSETPTSPFYAACLRSSTRMLEREAFWVLGPFF